VRGAPIRHDAGVYAFSRMVARREAIGGLMHKGRPWQSVGVGVDADKSSVIEGASRLHHAALGRPPGVARVKAAGGHRAVLGWLQIPHLAEIGQRGNRVFEGVPTRQ